ncbi:unnamed protein product [Acanthoscelides obtectus]|uniref:Reverse transcriptase domain-containing protein n=1 Tax=Acanthoscelides obtectus TaxID=200917 RepID=A0A9P0NVG4_ACAOB|nr:unnamed protein product [Acanthoscelides obtectus]CAK1627886.1 hypothetical protein AOBTE_LOCUS4885 [Acanthoscelides obtectus]
MVVMGKLFSNVSACSATAERGPCFFQCPQGSHIGPVLFTLFVNGDAESISNSRSCLIFAGDLRLFKTVKISTMRKSDKEIS